MIMVRSSSLTTVMKLTILKYKNSSKYIHLYNTVIALIENLNHNCTDYKIFIIKALIIILITLISNNLFIKKGKENRECPHKYYYLSEKRIEEQKVT